MNKNIYNRKGAYEMKNLKPYWITVILLSASLVFAYGLTADAGNTMNMSVKDYEKISYGGLLYDKWYSMLGADPQGTHPSYPAAGQSKGGSTWRCKECHGWDYKGKDGAYASGSHFSGIKGIIEYAGKKPEVVHAVLKNETHAFGSMIPGDAMEALSMFVAYGQINMANYIDSSTKKVSGNIQNGAKIYTSTCAKCHGKDGKMLNFKTAEKPEYLGTIANKNPWETMHKLRYGQPKSQMVSMLFLDIHDQVDILSYCQTLPVK